MTKKVTENDLKKIIQEVTMSLPYSLRRTKKGLGTDKRGQRLPTADEIGKTPDELKAINGEKYKNLSGTNPLTKNKKRSGLPSVSYTWTATDATTDILPGKDFFDDAGGQQIGDIVNSLGLELDKEFYFGKGLNSKLIKSVSKWMGKQNFDQNSDGKIDADELELYMIDGRLPTRGNGYKLNRIKMELLLKNYKTNVSAENYLDSTLFKDKGQMISTGAMSFVMYSKLQAIAEKYAPALFTKIEAVRKSLTQASPDPTTEFTGAGSTITDPTMITGLSDSGQALPAQFNMFQKFFEYNGAPASGTGGSSPEDLKKRLEALTKFSADLKDKVLTEDDDSSEIKTPEHFLTNLLMLEYFNRFAIEMDHGSGAYVFETFLAYLAGGKSAGKTKGATGGMGVVDFYFGDGSLGSAKYLQKGTTVSNKADNFTEGVPVRYIVANKTDASGERTSDIEELYEIKIYSFDVELVQRSPKVLFKYYNSKGETQGEPGVTEFKSHMGDPVGSMFFPRTPNKTLEMGYQKMAADLGDQIKSSFAAFEKVFDNLKLAKEKITNFSTNADVEAISTTKPDGGDGVQALKHMDLADEAFATLVTAMAPGKKVKGTAGSRTIDENKITSNFLKKLISESFKR